MSVIVSVWKPHVGDIAHIPFRGVEQIEAVGVHVLLVEVCETSVAEGFHKVGSFGE